MLFEQIFDKMNLSNDFSHLFIMNEIFLLKPIKKNVSFTCSLQTFEVFIENIDYMIKTKFYEKCR